MAEPEDDRDGPLTPEREAAAPETDKDGEPVKRDRNKRSKRRKHDTNSDDDDSSSSSSESEDERRRSKVKKRRHSRSSRSRSGRNRSESDSEEDSSSHSGSDSDLGSESEKRRERRRRREKDERRRKDKERERRKRKKDKEEKRKKEKKKKMKEKEKKKDKGKIGAVTNSWGKYGIIRETDMWNKRPEFTAWLSEVKKFNLEALSNWEEKQMFKEFMEDHNTATFPSKKYYNLEAYHRNKIEKDVKKGLKRVPQTERTIFNDEEIRRREMMRVKEKEKEAEVEALKRSMQSGMAKAMKEQALLREEMILQYRLGNHEAAAAIQKRLDPDPPM